MRIWQRRKQATVEVSEDGDMDTLDIGIHGDRDFQDAMIWAYRSIASRFFDVVEEAWELWR